jgi:predicted ATPase
VLCGRDPERARISELLAAARQWHSGVLVITGEPGVGKSALLAEAREQASGMRVLSGEGVQSEAELPFAALHQLVRPILGELERIPELQADALRAALGLSAGSANDRFLVSLAVLSLLADAAEHEPLLCLIDDAQWLDNASADALVFVARRLDVEGIVMLFAAREGDLRTFEARGLPTLQLAGLDRDAAADLLDTNVDVRFSSAVREQLIDGTGGNPLALIELSSALTAAQLSGAEPLATPIPISAGVERAFLARVRRLPEDTQTILLVAAAEDTGAVGTVLLAAARLGVAGQALDAAEQAGLARARRGQLVFRHPLVRSAVYQAAPLSRRQAVHRALADVIDDPADADRRVWHLAAASVEPDPSIVDELEAAAHRAHRRSGFGAASVAFERAAVLSSSDDARARRLTAAGTDAWLAGQGARARLLLDQARSLTAERIERADIDRLLGQIEMTRGDPAEACGELVRAATEIAAVDAARALHLLNLASIGATYAGDRDAAVAIAHLAGSLELGDAVTSRTLQQVLVGVGAYFEGDFATAARLMRRAPEVDGIAGQDELTAHPASLLFAGRAAWLLGEDHAILDSAHAAASAARANGLLGMLTHSLTRVGHGELWAGRWGAAFANAREGLQLARDFD